jgi:hypothetical protein
MMLFETDPRLRALEESAHALDLTSEEPVHQSDGLEEKSMLATAPPKETNARKCKKKEKRLGNCRK